MKHFKYYEQRFNGGQCKLVKIRVACSYVFGLFNVQAATGVGE